MVYSAGEIIVWFTCRIINGILFSIYIILNFAMWIPLLVWTRFIECIENLCSAAVTIYTDVFCLWTHTLLASVYYRH